MIELTDRLTARHGTEFDLELEALVALGDGASSGLYQIVREALDQAVHRGPPKRIAVVLTATPAGGVVLTITDDATRERRQAVLDGLSERADELNGSLSVDHAEGTTMLRVSLPPSATVLYLPSHRRPQGTPARKPRRPLRGAQTPKGCRPLRGPRNACRRLVGRDASRPGPKRSSLLFRGLRARNPR